MSDTLQWRTAGVDFEDGSGLAEDWQPVYDSEVWHWQYDTHELSYSIYEHDGQYWKLYRARFVPEGSQDYAYRFGGQACRMALVRYRHRARSPHSSRLMDEGAEEWVRTYEVDESLHEVLRAGRNDPKYDAPYGRKRAA
ncbi:MAG: hypothetical protein AAF495_06175 [Pseudomonadota bacterium]